MVKHRIIPVVLMRNGVAVQSKGFQRYQRLGDPTTIVERLSDWAADELIYLDISRTGSYDMGRDDLHAANSSTPLVILEHIARRCFMPLAFGGGIRTLDDCAERLRLGADKIVINTQAVVDPTFIDDCARVFGAQCIVICIDVRAVEGAADVWQVYAEGGRTTTGRDPITWARECEARGAGEVVIQSIDRDGRGQGYDLALISRMTAALTIPVIALGGAGTWSHLREGIEQGGAAAVAAANMFNYTEHSVYQAKRELFAVGADVREPILGYTI